MAQKYEDEDGEAAAPPDSMVLALSVPLAASPFPCSQLDLFLLTRVQKRA